MMREQWWLLGLLLALTGVRLLLAGCLPLSPDEAYYWVWSRHLQGGYFDHPFMVALWIRIGTWIAGDTPLGVRLLGPLSVLPGSYALFHAARFWLPERSWPLSGFQAVLLLNATLMIGVGAATLTPDTPLVFFVCVTLFVLGKALRAERGRAVGWWMLGGFFLGLTFDSKYTAVLIGGSMIGIVLTSSRLRNQTGPWLAIPAGMLATMPVVVWNWRHQWVSFLKQGGRTMDWHPARAIQFLSELLGGQIGLATPLVFGLFIFGVWGCFRRNRALAWLCGVSIIVFVVHAFGDRVQANWPAVVYPAFALAAVEAGRRVRWAVGSGIALSILVTIQALAGIIPVSPGKDPIQRQTAGWPDFATALRKYAMEKNADVLLAEDYGLASQLAFSGEMSVLGTDLKRWSLFDLAPQTAKTGILVTEMRRASSVMGEGNILCRYSHGKKVRCYRVVVMENPVGLALPRRS